MNVTSIARKSRQRNAVIRCARRSRRRSFGWEKAKAAIRDQDNAIALAAFGAKRTLSEPRSQNAFLQVEIDLNPHR
jgi:hypothetical protein